MQELLPGKSPRSQVQGLALTVTMTRTSIADVYTDGTSSDDFILAEHAFYQLNYAPYKVLSFSRAPG